MNEYSERYYNTNKLLLLDNSSPENNTLITARMIHIFKSLNAFSTSISQSYKILGLTKGTSTT